MRLVLPIDGHAQTLKSGALSPPRRVRSELVILNTAGTSWSSSTPGAEVRRDESTLTDALVVIAHTCPPHAVAGAHARLSCRQQATLDAGDTYCSSCARWHTAHAEKTPLCEV